MRPIVVAEALEFGRLDIERAHTQLADAELVELAGPAALARSTQALCLGLLGGSANRAMPRCWQAVSDSLPAKLASMATLMRSIRTIAGFSPAVAVAPPLGPGAPVVER